MISMGFGKFQQLLDKLMAIFACLSALVATILKRLGGTELKRPTKRAKQASPAVVQPRLNFVFVQSRCQLYFF